MYPVPIGLISTKFLVIKVEEWNQSVYKGKGIHPPGGGGVPARLAAISLDHKKFSGNKPYASLVPELGGGDCNVISET